MKEGNQISKTVQAGNRLIELITYKHVISFKKKDPSPRVEMWVQRQKAEWWTQSANPPWAQRMNFKPQRIISRS